MRIRVWGYLHLSAESVLTLIITVLVKVKVWVGTYYAAACMSQVQRKKK